MAQWLNKFFAVLLFCFATGDLLLAQEPSKANKYDDYKDKDQFKKFLKRRRVIGAWQINQLKTGALVVRLRTNARLIETLKVQGNTELARQKYFETYVMNKNTMMAYRNNYDFSKLYFIYSSSSDSLLKGARTGIFLDTALNVDPNIIMNEDFYLLAERDYVFNSSIGFVPIDSAEKQIERGNPGTEMIAVIKNKFGHQLKEPFPYNVGDLSLSAISYRFIGTQNEKSELIWFMVESAKQESDIKSRYPQLKDWLRFDIKKQFYTSKLSLPIQQLNLNLRAYFQATPPPDMTRIDPEIKKFLY